MIQNSYSVCSSNRSRVCPSSSNYAIINACVYTQYSNNDKNVSVCSYAHAPTTYECTNPSNRRKTAAPITHVYPLLTTVLLSLACPSLSYQHAISYPASLTCLPLTPAVHTLNCVTNALRLSSSSRLRAFVRTPDITPFQSSSPTAYISIIVWRARMFM